MMEVSSKGAQRNVWYDVSPVRHTEGILYLRVVYSRIVDISSSWLAERDQLNLARVCYVWTHQEGGGQRGYWASEGMASDPNFIIWVLISQCEEVLMHSGTPDGSKCIAEVSWNPASKQPRAEIQEDRFVHFLEELKQTRRASKRQYYGLFIVKHCRESRARVVPEAVTLNGHLTFQLNNSVLIQHQGFVE